MKKVISLWLILTVLLLGCKSPFVILHTIKEPVAPSIVTASVAKPTLTEKPELVTTKYQVEKENIEKKLKETIKETEAICYANSKITESVLEINGYSVKHDANFPMRLGYGISLKNLQAAYIPAITYEMDTIEGKGSSQTKFEAKLINNYSDLKTFLEIDYKAEVSAFGFGGASLSANFKRDFRFTENSLYFVIKGSTEYGRIGLKNIALKDEALNLYNTNPTEFVNKYGFAFPIVQNHGAKIYLLFKLRTTDESLKQSLSTNASGNISLGIFSASTNISIKSTIDQLIKSKDYELSVFSEGSESFKGIDDLLSSFKGDNINIDAIISNSAKYLTTFVFNTSAPISYNLMYYKQLGLKNLPNEDDYIKRYSFLQNILDIYITNKEQLKKFDIIFNNPTLLEAFFKNKQEDLKQLKTDREILIKTQQLLYSSFDLYKHKDPIEESTCIDVPKGFNPYQFAGSKFFDFDVSNFNSAKIKGLYIDDVTLTVNLFIPGTGDIELNPIINSRVLNSFGSMRTTSGNNEVEVSFDIDKAIKEFYQNRIKPVIRANPAPTRGSDLLIYTYFHPETRLNTGKILRGFVYIKANNAIGFEDKRIVGRIFFDGNSINIIPLNK